MKKRIVYVCAIAGLLFPAVSHAAVDLSLGGLGWYTWWKPAWSDNKSNIALLLVNTMANYIENGSNFKPSSGAMAGPTISVGFLDRWYFSSNLTMGKFVATAKGPTGILNFLPYNYNSPPIGVLFKTYRRDIIKWDSDTTVGCKISRYFKIYAGFKSQGYYYKETIKYMDFSGPIVFRIRLTDEVNCYGPGMGIGVTVPLGGNFYTILNLSGIVLWAKEKGRFKDMYGINLQKGEAGIAYLRLPRGAFRAYGGSGSLSFAYYIEKIGTTLSLGGRYQLLYNRQKAGNVFKNDVTMNIIDRKYDHFFGITMSAIYTFHIGS